MNKVHYNIVSKTVPTVQQKFSINDLLNGANFKLVIPKDTTITDCSVLLAAASLQAIDNTKPSVVYNLGVNCTAVNPPTSDYDPNSDTLPIDMGVGTDPNDIDEGDVSVSFNYPTPSTTYFILQFNSNGISGNLNIYNF